MLTGGQRYPVAYLTAEEAFSRIGITLEQLEWKKLRLQHYLSQSPAEAPKTKPQRGS